uniref:Uncharacterized protein n=1 Tax=Rhizophora mucronata TaxID=61149 RepID=A0A2P2QDR8_RHIMU
MSMWEDCSTLISELCCCGITVTHIFFLCLCGAISYCPVLPEMRMRKRSTL